MAQAKKPTKAQRRQEALAAAARLREEQKAKERRNRFIAIGVIVAVLAVLTVVVMMILREGNKSPLERVETKPSIAQNDGALFIGQGAALGADPNPDAPTVSVYVDFLCHFCKEFDDAFLTGLMDQAANGEINLKYYPVAILAGGDNGYSTRTASAVYAVAQESPESLVPFVQAVFALQEQALANPNAMPTNTDLANAALGAGVPSAVAQAIEKETTFGSYVTAVTQHAAQLVQTNYREALPKGLSTPFILINDIPLDPSYYRWTAPGKFEQAVADAIAGQYKYSWQNLPNDIPAGTPAPVETPAEPTDAPTEPSEAPSEPDEESPTATP